MRPIRTVLQKPNNPRISAWVTVTKAVLGRLQTNFMRRLNFLRSYLSIIFKRCLKERKEMSRFILYGNYKLNISIIMAATKLMDARVGFVDLHLISKLKSWTTIIGPHTIENS